ncbi:MAG: glycosyltransferase family 9 protein [Candidatus Zhuqueibacterota bacterium]
MSWKKFSTSFRNRTMRLLEKILGRKVLSSVAVNLSAIDRILVIRQHDQLGDFLLATPVLRALREHFPQSHITVLVRGYTREAALHNEYINDVIYLPESGYNYSLGWLREFWKKLRRRYELAVVLNTVSHSLSSDILSHLSRSKFVLGSAHRIFPGCQRNFFYSFLAPYDAVEKHQTERNLDIVRYLGIDTRDRSEVMTITEEERNWAVQFLRDNGLTAGLQPIGIHPGAGKIENRWQVEKFAEVAGYWFQASYMPVLFWGPKEVELGQMLLSQVNFKPIVCDGLALRQFAAIVQQMEIFLCNDTGVMHVAAAVGTPLVAIFGPTEPSLWKPLGERFRVVRTSDRDCHSVTVDMVLDMMKTLLPKIDILPD